MPSPKMAAASLNEELADAGNGLVGNDDVLRAVLAGSGDCIKIIDLEGRLQFMSEGGKRVMEVEDFAALKGCPWPDLWAGERNGEAQRAIDTARAGGTAKFKGSANTAKGHPRVWDVTVSPIFSHDGRVSHILSISRDITIEWQALEELKAAVQRQSVLTGELEHRIKNMLQIVGAIAYQTIRGDVDAARKTFAERLVTLGHANDILTRTSWQTAPIADVVEAALQSHGTWSTRISVSGPPFQLNAERALALSLALHELTTNAVKYGALSVEDGTVRIEWGCDSEFEFCWTESGGPDVIRPAHASRSFGTRLLEGVLADAFDGKVTLSFDTEGFACVLAAPFEGSERNL